MNSHERKGWFGRNWKWLLPVGCLGMAVMIVGFVAAIIFFIFGALKSSDVFQQAITKTRSNAIVVSEMGEPIETGWKEIDLSEAAKSQWDS